MFVQSHFHVVRHQATPSTTTIHNYHHRNHHHQHHHHQQQQQQHHRATHSNSRRHIEQQTTSKRSTGKTGDNNQSSPYLNRGASSLAFRNSVVSTKAGAAPVESCTRSNIDGHQSSELYLDDRRPWPDASLIGSPQWSSVDSGTSSFVSSSNGYSIGGIGGAPAAAGGVGSKRRELLLRRWRSFDLGTGGPIVRGRCDKICDTSELSTDQSTTTEAQSLQCCAKYLDRATGKTSETTTTTTTNNNNADYGDGAVQLEGHWSQKRRTNNHQEHQVADELTCSSATGNQHESSSKQHTDGPTDILRTLLECPLSLGRSLTNKVFAGDHISEARHGSRRSKLSALWITGKNLELFSSFCINFIVYQLETWLMLVHGATSSVNCSTRISVNTPAQNIQFYSKSNTVFSPFNDCNNAHLNNTTMTSSVYSSSQEIRPNSYYKQQQQQQQQQPRQRTPVIRVVSQPLPHQPSDTVELGPYYDHQYYHPNNCNASSLGYYSLGTRYATFNECNPCAAETVGHSRLHTRHTIDCSSGPNLQHYDGSSSDNNSRASCSHCFGPTLAVSSPILLNTVPHDVDGDWSVHRGRGSRAQNYNRHLYYHHQQQKNTLLTTEKVSHFEHYENSSPSHETNSSGQRFEIGCRRLPIGVSLSSPTDRTMPNNGPHARGGFIGTIHEREPTSMGSDSELYKKRPSHTDRIAIKTSQKGYYIHTPSSDGGGYGGRPKQLQQLGAFSSGRTSRTSTQTSLVSVSESGSVARTVSNNETGHGARKTHRKLHQTKSFTKVSLSGAKRRLGFMQKGLNSLSVHRSEEIVPPEASSLAHQSSATSSLSEFYDENPAWFSKLCIPDARCGFLEGLGQGQMASRQALVSPYLGDIQLGISDQRGMLEVEVVRVRQLQPKSSLKRLPSPYVKVYLMRDKKCIAKFKTAQVKHSLDPLFQQRFIFRDDYANCILQVIVWGDYGKKDRKMLMGVVQIHLEDLDMSKLVISWYKLFNAPSMASSIMSLSSKALRQTLSKTKIGEEALTDDDDKLAT